MFSGFTALYASVVASNGTLQLQELPAGTWPGSQVTIKGLRPGADSRICPATC